MTTCELSNNSFINLVKDGVLYADSEEIPEAILKITTRMLRDWHTLDDNLVDKLEIAIKKYRKERDY